MHNLSQDYPGVLLRNEATPCLSLYQTTHRQHPDNVQDPIRFRNLVKELGESLAQKYPKRETASLLEPFEALANDEAFWNHTADGLAVLGAPGMFRVYRLQRPVRDFVVVADSFHTKPLMRITQSTDQYQVLGLSRDSFKLYEGNRDSLMEVHLPDDPVGPIGNRDTEHYFRAVDQAIQQRQAQSGGMGLILAALPEHHGLFRTVSKNAMLMNDAIDVHPDAMPIDALRERAWQIIQPHYLERLAGFVDAYGAGSGKGQSAGDLTDVAKAAVEGRVATLLIEAARMVPGQVDASSGAVTMGTLGDPEVDDLLDDLGELVLKNGGEVVMVPKERMPTTTGAAAVFRF